MNNYAMEILEYGKIIANLKEYAVSEPGKEMIEKLVPADDINVICSWLRETTETRGIIDKSSSIPLYSLSGIDKVMNKFSKASILTPEDLSKILEVTVCAKKLKVFMKDKELIAQTVASYAASMYELEDLREEIDRCIRDYRVDDRASSDLLKIRKKLHIVEERIKSKLDGMLRSTSYNGYFQDSLVSMRQGKYVIPVKKEYKKNFQGEVLDVSASGSTVFIEPTEIKKLREELNLLKIEEEKEEYRILSFLTGLAESYEKELKINIETMTYYDFLFAKAKYSRAINGNTVSLNTNNYIKIVNGRHPLITNSPVPLQFEIGNGYRALVITGPNTGGKTVVLKTVGLLTMMVQSGLHVPVENGSEFAVFYEILADIGDGQSIEQSLSTFSSHIKNIVSIMKCAEPDTMVIFDEIGAGTDPGEGMGLATAVLEDVYSKGSTIIATTHYSEIKNFAKDTPGFKNGCMGFDINTLKPLYKLQIGISGESNAFLIALRLGVDKEIIGRAHEITYKEKKEYENFSFMDCETAINEEIISDKQHNEQKREDLKQKKKKVEKKRVDSQFKTGDSVYITTLDRLGIVCEEENTKGEIGVLVMKKKLKINKKRLKLYVESKELYPEGYDMDIIFESVENRKKRKAMSKKYQEGMIIESKSEE